MDNYISIKAISLAYTQKPLSFLLPTILVCLIILVYYHAKNVIDINFTTFK